jgi:oligo-alginate lyase
MNSLILFVLILLGIMKGGVAMSYVDIQLPELQPYPSVACTLDELERLRSAYSTIGSGHEVVMKQLQQAELALKHDVEFPPEGGQHNQWYQCDQCQIALEAVDDTHHRCPKCKQVYSGYPYDNVIYSQKHYRMTRDMDVCAWAFAITGEEKYARRVRDILMGYARRYTSYPYHSANMGKKTDQPSSSGGHVFEQTLNEASWMLPVCTAYDLTRISNVFSESDHRSIREDFLWKVYENINKHRAGKSNWQTYHNSAFMLIGGVLNKVELIRQAIEDKDNGFYYQMGISVLPGGMWYENSWGYHFYTLGAVQQITETARRLGINLYSVPQVKDMYTVAMDYQMVDGTLPRFGDATTTRIPGRFYESAYHQWKDPFFLSILPKQPTWDSILYGRTDEPETAKQVTKPQNMLKSGAGHAILQSDGEKGRSSAVVTFGPFGGFHGHFDKLSFVYFGLGRELGYDPGRALSQAYRLPIHSNWYRATTSHNTVMVDRSSQAGVEGTSDLFVVSPELSATVANTDKAYKGIMHQRLLILRPGFLVVADILTATDGKDHTFDWMYHNLGNKIQSDSAQQSAELPDGQGFEYLEDVRRGTTDESIRATVTLNEDRVEITVNAEAESEVLVGSGVGESVMDRVPLIFVTRRGQNARFAAVIEPVSGNKPSDVVDVEILDRKTDEYLIRIRLRDGKDEIYSYDPKGIKRNVEGIDTCSKLLSLKRESTGQYRILAEYNQDR